MSSEQESQVSVDAQGSTRCKHCNEVVPTPLQHWGGYEYVCATAATRLAADDGELLDYDEGGDDD